MDALFIQTKPISMKKHYRAFLIIGWITFLSTALFATHNRSGEITFRQLSSNTVEAFVTTYTKASSTSADRDSITVCWGDDFCERLPRVNGPDPDEDGNGNGEILSNDYKMNIYRGIHTYDNFGQFKIYLQDPNRNDGILNVNFPNSAQVFFYVEATLNLSADGSLNASPVLLERPVDIAYVGQPFVHVPNAFDIEDDSIAYELVTPMSGPGMEVPNYQPVNAISPGPNNSVSLDEETGVFIWDAPQREGEYNIAILIKSYRNGILIDQITRDMQILVRQQDNPVPSISADPFSEEIIEVSIGDTVRVALEMSDINQPITIASSCGLYDFFINPAFFTPNEMGNEGTADFEWVVRAEHLRTQPYQVAFEVADEIGLAAYIVMRYKIVDQVSNTDDPFSKDIQLTLFPNPTAQLLKVQVPESILPAKYQIVNANGQILRQGIFRSSTTELDISKLPSAAYFLQVWEGSSYGHGAFIVR